MARTLDYVTHLLDSAYDYFDTLVSELSHNAHCGGHNRATCTETSHKLTAAQYSKCIADQQAHITNLETEYRSLGGK